MSLLRANAQQAAEKAVMFRRERRQSALRNARYGADGSAVPANMVRLARPQDQGLLLRYLTKQAQREQEGFQPGDVFSQATSHPAVQEELQP